MRRGKVGRPPALGNEASVLVGDFLLGQAFKMMVEVGSLRALEILVERRPPSSPEATVHAAFRSQEHRTTEDEYSASSVPRPRSCSRRPAKSARRSAPGRRTSRSACRSFGMNLGIAFQLVDDAWIRRQGHQAWQECRRRLPRGKITLPVVFHTGRLGNRARRFWRHLTGREASNATSDEAISLMAKHRAIEIRYSARRHYGAIARRPRLVPCFA